MTPQEQVPAEYRDLYDQLASKLISFRNSIPEQPPGGAPPKFSAELLYANGNRGLSLLGSMNNIQLELDRLTTLGISRVSIALNYPLLVKSFWKYSGDPEKYHEFLDFYLNLTGEIQARGLSLYADNNVILPGVHSADSGLDCAGYYAELSFAELVETRSAMASVIIGNLHPAGLNLGSEPDTVASALGLPTLSEPSGFGIYIARTVAGIRCNLPNHTTPLSAGVSTWTGNGTDFIDALALTGIDTFDTHVYPINFDCLLPRLEQYVSHALSLGLRPSMSECWLQKRRDSEWGPSGIDDNTFRARDAFSFWKPLDQSFLTSLIDFARWKGFSHFSPFWTRYFHAYLDYADCEGLTPQEIYEKSAQAAHYGMTHGNLTQTAEVYREAIR